MDRVAELLLAARDGNRLALEDAVRATEPDVRRLCRHLGDPDTVDDLVQDTYARALRSLPDYRGEGSGRGWVLTIARRTCADATRSRRRWRRIRDDRAEPEQAAIDDDDLVVHDLLGGLGPERRDAFVLTQILGFSYAETAEVLGCPVGTVRSRVARAREDLLDVVDPETGASSVK